MAKVQGNGLKRQQSEKEEPRFDQALSEPGDYEVTKETKFRIDIPLARSSNWWVIANTDDAERIEYVEFRMWTYDEMVEMRSNSTKYDQHRRVHMIDHDILNRQKIQKLVTDWSFGENNPRLGLHHVNGVMTDESWDRFAKLQPNIVRFVLEGMNDWLEHC